MAPSIFDNLLECYLEVQIGHTTMHLNLHEAWSQFVEAVALIDSDQTTTTYLARLAGGGPVELPAPIFIDLEENSFRLRSDSDIAAGQAERVFVKIHGALYPQEDAVKGTAPGCGAMPSNELMQAPLTVAEFRRRALNARQARAFTRGGKL